MIERLPGIWWLVVLVADALKLHIYTNILMRTHNIHHHSLSTFRPLQNRLSRGKWNESNASRVLINTTVFAK